MPNRFSKVLFIALGLSSLLFMLHALGVMGKNIGLYQDGLWDFFPAVGMLKAHSIFNSQEIKIFGYPLPLVSSPYSGALKIWILAPLLALWGTSPQIVLALNVLFGLIYLLALYWALLPVVDKTWASLVFLLPLIDANYLLTVPLDDGIFVFQYIFISLTIGALFRYLANSQLKYYWMAWFFSGCILAQKLTSIPIVISFVIIIIILSFRQFFQLAGTLGTKRAVTRFVAFSAAPFLVPLLPHSIYFLKTGLHELFAMTADGRRAPYFSALSYSVSFFSRMFDGSDWYRRITLDTVSDVAVPPYWAISGIAIISCSFLLYFTSDDKKKYGRYTVVCIGLGTCSFLLYPAFRGLDRPWHFYVLAPTFICCCIIAAANCVSHCLIAFKKYGRVSVLLLSIVFSSGVALSASHGIRMLKEVETHKGACLTSPGVYDIYKEIAASNVRRIYTINYSLAYSFYVFSKGSVSFEDMAWTDLTREKIEGLFQKIKMDPELGIAYRYCGNKDWDPNWIRWLNREPQIFDFMKRLEIEGSTLTVVRCKDDRQTEYALITQTGEKKARQ
jgi:hypothetical protein